MVTVDPGGRQVLPLGQLTIDEGFIVTGASGSAATATMSAAGDINGDGIDDWMVGAAFAGNGTAYVLYGQTSDRPSFSLSSFTSKDGFAIRGGASGDFTSVSLTALGDVNGDGIDDIAVGSSGDDTGGFNAGSVAIILGQKASTRTDINLGSLAAKDGVLLTGPAGDRVGNAVASAGDLNGDGLGDIIVGSDIADADVGRAYVVYGSTTAFAGPSLKLDSLGGAGFIIKGDDSFDRFGGAVTSVGDINGDGRDDLAVGARYAYGPSNTTSGSTGGAYVLYGNAAGTQGAFDVTNMASAQGFKIIGAPANSELGYAVSAAGDFNDDGIGDLVVTAWHSEFTYGAAYLIYGKAGAARTTIDLTSLSPSDGFVIRGDRYDGYLGASVATGDFDGDGVSDIVIGSSSSPLDNGGTAYVLFGRTGTFGVADKAGRQVLDLATLAPTDGAVLLADAADGGTFKRIHVVANLGDINKDGIDDIGIGDPNSAAAAANAGAGHIVYGRTDWGHGADVGSGPDTGLCFDGDGHRVLGLGELGPFDGFEIAGAAANDQATFSVSTAGDVNDDGIGDWIIGAPGNDRGGADAGIAYVLFGRDGLTRADISLGSLTSQNGFAIVGAAAGDHLGVAVAGIGDVNGDGIDDIVVGAGDSDAGGTDSGAAYVIFGKTGATRADVQLSSLTSASGLVFKGAAGDFAGRSVSAAGDINNDEISDFAIGAAGSAASEGKVYIVYGSKALAGGSLDSLAGKGLTVTGDNAYDQFGSVVAFGGDMNGDNRGDLIIGARYADPSTTAQGADGRVYVLLGGSSLLTSGGDVTGLAPADGYVIRGAPGSGAGASLSSAGYINSAFFDIAGDINNDGYSDLIIGGYTAGGATNAGEAYVIFGKGGAARGPLDLANLSPTDGFVIRGEANTLTGISVSAAGDINRDGRPDLLVATSSKGVTGQDVGAAYLIFGRGGAFGSKDGSGRYVLDVSTLDQTDGVVLLHDTDAPNASGTRFTVSAIGDVNHDFITDFMIGDVLSDLGGADAGHGYVIFGRETWLDRTIPVSTTDAIEPVTGLPADTRLTITAPANTIQVGMAIAGVGDINGDGIADFAVQAHVNDPIEGEVNANYIFYGRPGFDPGTFNLADFGPGDGFIVYAPEGLYAPDSPAVSGYNYSGLAAAGDFNGDGIGDLMFDFSRDGAGNVPFYKSGAFVVYGVASETRGNLRISALAPTDGVEIVVNDFVGFAASLGDINNDGIDDLGLMEGSHFVTTPPGTAYILYGRTAPLGSPINPSDPASPLRFNVADMTATDGFRIQGDEGFDGFPANMAAAGDVNGDGVDDFIIGSPYGGSTKFSQIPQGEVQVIFGKAGGTRADFDINTLGANGVTIYGAGYDGMAGAAISGLGDINGDGYADILIGGPDGDSGGGIAGEAFVIFGKPAATWASIDLASLAPADGFVIQGDFEADLAGYSVAGAGDFNGDGYSDILVGAPGNQQDTGIEAGSAYLIFGHAGGFGTIDGTGRRVIDLTNLTPQEGIQFVGELDGDFFGMRVAAPGDVDADGYADLLIGAPSYYLNTGWPNEPGPHNQAYILFGHATGASAAPSAGDDHLTGTSGDDYFALQQGGADQAIGGDGNDGFLFGPTFGAGDRVYGGEGDNDQLGVQGDYTGANAIVISAGQVSGVEVLAALPGGDYEIATNDVVPAGKTFVVYGSTLGVGDNLTVDGSAQSNTNLIVYAGQGADHLTGGAGADGFYFGPGRFSNATDTIDGGAGANDQLGLDGDYALTLSGANIHGIEVIVMIQGPGLPANTFSITTADDLVAAGSSMTIYGVQVTNALTFNGAAETDGRFTVFGGHGGDSIVTGAGDDWIHAGDGADDLTGGLGADTFAYDNAGQSTGAGYDTLHGFDFAVDRLDLPGTHDSYAYVSSGTLNAGPGFDGDLAAALGGMAADQAVFFDPNSGTLAGSHFLIVDGNGVAGYQAGADYVFRFDVPAPSSPPPDFFI